MKHYTRELFEESLEETMKKAKVTILAQYGNYTVLKRDTKIQPFVVACNMHDDMTWDFGNYFDDLFAACDYARSRGEPGFISWRRMSEIASAAINMLLESNSGSARALCEDNLCLEPEEMEHFGINSESSDEEVYSYIREDLQNLMFITGGLENEG